MASNDPGSVVKGLERGCKVRAVDEADATCGMESNVHRENVIAALKVKTVDRFYKVARKVIDLNAAAVVELTIRKWLRDQEELVYRVELDIGAARSRSLRIGSREQDRNSAEVTQIVELHG